MRNWYHSEHYGDMKALISHEEESIPLIQSVVKDGDFRLIIELGSAYYGMTLLLHECNKETPLFTFDVHDPRLWMTRAKNMVSIEDLNYILKKGFSPCVNFVVGDILENENLFLLTLVNNPLRKLLYCDNGDKNIEINRYGVDLNSGDILGTHDWITEANPDKIKVTLDLFDPHPINETFKEKNLLTRFFIKR